MDIRNMLPQVGGHQKLREGPGTGPPLAPSAGGSPAHTLLSEYWLSEL